MNKSVIINSEASKEDQNFIPQKYINNGQGTIKISLNEEVNRHAEGEGRAVTNLVRNHLDDNCLIVSNDTDSLLYTILAATEERNIYQHCRRVAGVYRYMHSYIQDLGAIDWTNYGFQFDSEVDSFIPIIFTKDPKEKNNSGKTKDPKQKNNSSIEKVKEHPKRKNASTMFYSERCSKQK